jgi:hypothetical protein
MRAVLSSSSSSLLSARFTKEPSEQTKNSDEERNLKRKAKQNNDMLT